MRHYPPRSPRSTHGHWTTTRDRATQATFRAALIKRAGMRCEWADTNGRCPRTTGLQAHHTQPGNNDPATGLLLCQAHHKTLDPHAR
jgi:hypothetical protein